MSCSTDWLIKQNSDEIKKLSIFQEPTAARDPVHSSRRWRVDLFFEIDSLTISFTDTFYLGSGRSTVQSWILPKKYKDTRPMLLLLSGEDDMITILVDGIKSQPWIGIHYLSLGTIQ